MAKRTYTPEERANAVAWVNGNQHWEWCQRITEENFQPLSAGYRALVAFYLSRDSQDGTKSTIKITNFRPSKQELRRSDRPLRPLPVARSNVADISQMLLSAVSAWPRAGP